MGAAIFLIFLFITGCGLVEIDFGHLGLFGSVFESHPVLFPILYIVLMTHITITAMSLSFHRHHTHQGVRINPFIDHLMQIWLWSVTSMSKRDWVSVHIYHHAHSETEKDPHSPIQKGLAHVFFLGAFDYARAKSDPEVVKLRKHITQTPVEAFIDRNLFLGPIALSLANLICFGPFWGGMLSLINFLVSPVFAVGGVNALAHYVGYRNYETTDNSRNFGFVFPLNWMICGELDHNNHHRHPKSCSFRHRWYEVDIGFIYLTMMSWVGLVQLKVIAPKKKRVLIHKTPLPTMTDAETVSLTPAAATFSANPDLVTIQS